jgi:hypothetical protein
MIMLLAAVLYAVCVLMLAASGCALFKAYQLTAAASANLAEAKVIRDEGVKLVDEAISIHDIALSVAGDKDALARVIERSAK